VPPPEHFVIVGAQRSGTSYLYGLLNEHPDIEMATPMRPEPKFFLDDDAYARGLDYYEQHCFPGSRAGVRGEKSTSYIESEVAAQRIMTLLPDALVVVVLRDPVQRALSNYAFTVAHGNENLDIGEALRASATGERHWDHDQFSVSPYAYLQRGRYADYLERYVRHVPRAQIHVVMFEDLVENHGAITELYRRLGVDSTFEPSGLGVPVNSESRDGECISGELMAFLRDYYLEPDRRLEEFLGRALPWVA
jgi:Sulfotransferase domain